MASAPDGFESRDPPPVMPRLADEALARPPEQNLLDAIMTETALGELVDNEFSAEDLRLLREVATEYPTAPFDLEPVAVELVRAVIGEPFRALLGGREQWATMTYEIARTLWDDPCSRQRLKSLWNRLREAAS